MKTKWRKPASFLLSFKHALKGIGYSIYSQRNLAVHLIMGMAACGLGLFFKIEPVEWMLLFLAVTCVLITELINTAIEILVDLVTRRRRFRAMLSKDIAAGAVLIASINAAVVGYFIFIKRIMGLF
ncbi:diacylglycerol kinase family protein [Thermoproteota archaeon]